MLSNTALGVIFVACAACAACAQTPPAATAAAPASAAPATTAAPTASAAPPAAAPVSQPATVSDVLVSQRGALDGCYAQARAAAPALGRTSVGMTFVIDAAGKPKTVDLQYKHRMDDRAKECLRDAALGLHFPASLAGTQTGTIVFTPPGP